MLHVLKLHESHDCVPTLSTLADVIWGPPHTGLGPVSPSECPHRPVVPAEAAQTAACVLRTLATVTTIPATGAPAYCLQQHGCPSKETKHRGHTFSLCSKLCLFLCGMLGMIQQLRHPFLRHFRLVGSAFLLHHVLADQWVVVIILLVFSTK